MPQPHTFLIYCAMIAAIALGLMACSDSEDVQTQRIYADYPVEFDDAEEQIALQGKPVLILGVYEEQLFRTLNANDPVAIVQGTQGGTWVHLSIRVAGVTPEGVIQATLGDISQIDYPLVLTRSPEGFLEAYDVPIPVRLTDEEIEMVEGGDAMLSVSFTTEEATVSSTLSIVLIRG